MEINLSNNHCIIKPLCQKITKREAERLFDEVKNHNEALALDMSFVNDCTIDFIELFKDIKNLSLFNINSDIFSLFLSMNLDKTFKLFVSELDFIEDRHQLINRKFSIV